VLAFSQSVGGLDLVSFDFGKLFVAKFHVFTSLFVLKKSTGRLTADALCFDFYARVYYLFLESRDHAPSVRTLPIKTVGVILIPKHGTCP
jgi:hypothetical protein